MDDDIGRNNSIAQANAFLGQLAAGAVFGCAGEVECPRPLSTIQLSDGFALLEKQIRRVATVLMNPQDYQELRKYGTNELEPETQAKWLKRGCFSWVWGAYIIINREVTEGVVYLLAEENGEGTLVSVLRVK